MSDADTKTKEEKLFEVVLETRNLEISLFWQRSNYFLVLNSALAVGFFSMKRHTSFSYVLAAFGVVVAALWFLVNLGSKYWQARWEYELAHRETSAFGEEHLFGATRDETDIAVRESLKYSGHGSLTLALNFLILLKPSVSKTMTALSLVFCAAWVALLLTLIGSHS